jgi:hypothetical protein
VATTYGGDAALAAIIGAWDGVCVYDTMGRGKDDEVLVIGHKGSTYLFALVASDGSREDVTDALSQNYWLEDALSGRLPLIWSPKDSRQTDLV